MSDVAITIKLPEELIERARAAGMSLEEQPQTITEAVEKEVKRREALRGFRELADKLEAPSGAQKPTSDEVDRALRAARAALADARPLTQDRLTNLMLRLWTLPDEFKPSAQEIEAEIEAYWSTAAKANSPGEP